MPSCPSIFWISWRLQACKLFLVILLIMCLLIGKTIQAVAPEHSDLPPHRKDLVLSGKNPAPKSSPDVAVESIPRPQLMHNVGKQPISERVPFSASRPADMALPDITYMPFCSDQSISCQDLSAHCLDCDIVHVFEIPDCIYGEPANYTCRTKARVLCSGPTSFTFVAPCRYCYQTEPYEHSCVFSPCRQGQYSYDQRQRANCTTNHDVICLGNRRFYKSEVCAFTSGYRWSVAMFLSVTVGGFGADRFYLGHWQEGIGKLFSFGGLGIWTLVDIVLIAIGYLRPEDGSLYVDF